MNIDAADDHARPRGCRASRRAANIIAVMAMGSWLVLAAMPVAVVILALS